jgi:Fur family transcriptional regulator, iron response regulator
MAPKECNACSDPTNNTEHAIAMLELAGLRATGARVILTTLLFDDISDCHTTAEILYEKAFKAGSRVSLATVYNTLRLFTSVGLLRQISVNSTQVYFDTDTSEHQHFYNENTGELINIKENLLAEIILPELPECTRLMGVDMLVLVSN